MRTLARRGSHLVLETPKANLIDGMTWLQNAYTRKFNSRHKQWGRLFGDRNKSILVDDDRQGGGSSYLATLVDYLHLNPARAQIISPGKPKAESLLYYPWSSLAEGYALAPTKRPDWLKVAAGLELFGLRDTTHDRRRFVERLDARMAAEEAERCGIAEIEGHTLNSSLRRGWYRGSEGFKESLLRRLESREDRDGGLPRSAHYRSDSQANDHQQRTAERLIADGAAHFRLDGNTTDDFSRLPRGDIRRVAIAWALWRRTSVPQRWIADRVALRSANNVSRQVRMFDRQPLGKHGRDVRKWRKLVENLKS